MDTDAKADALQDLVGLFLRDLEEMGDLRGLDQGLLDDLRRAKNALEEVDAALSTDEED